MQVLLEELMEICEILKLYLKQEIVKLKIIKIKIEEFEIRKSGLLREEVLNAEELKDVNSSKLILHDFDFQKDIFSENPRKYIANPFLKLEYHQGNNK